MRRTEGLYIKLRLGYDPSRGASGPTQKACLLDQSPIACPDTRHAPSSEDREVFSRREERNAESTHLKEYRCSGPPPRPNSDTGKRAHRHRLKERRND